MLKYLQALWHREPARVTAASAAVVVFIAAKAGVVISEQDVLPALAVVLPILMGGEAVRGNVIPVRKLVTDYADIPDDADDTVEHGT